MISEMSAQALHNLSDVIKSYYDRDTGRAGQAYHADKKIDQMYKKLSKLLITHLQKDKFSTESGMHLFFIARNLERIGDHAKNIAEATLYTVTGEMNKFDMFDDMDNDQ